jgi:lysocardiolipin and lysophospholipid acyltransferase
MHGHFYIILKESLKYIPIMGQGMQFYNFIFMSRKWAKDKARMAYRLNKLKQKVSGRLTGEEALRPMWLLIFPEGTNLSQNTKANSSKWAAKQGIEDLQHQVLPRTTGTFFCLNELKGTVDFVYDCTLAYEGIP